MHINVKGLELEITQVLKRRAETRTKAQTRANYRANFKTQGRQIGRKLKAVRKGKDLLHK